MVNQAGWLDSPFQSRMKFRERNLLVWMYLQSGNKNTEMEPESQEPFLPWGWKNLENIFLSYFFFLFSPPPPCGTFRLNTRTIFVTSFWWLRKWTIDCEFFFFFVLSGGSERFYSWTHGDRNRDLWQPVLQTQGAVSNQRPVLINSYATWSLHKQCSMLWCT